MNCNSIIITADTLLTLPMDMQEAILAAVFGGKTSMSQNPLSASAASLLDEEDDRLAQLSPSQAREFYAGCGEKTRKTLEVIANSESSQFQLADIAKAIGVEPSGLRGVWSGLTRRLYTITGDNTSCLINWDSEGIFNEDGAYTDHIGKVSELTYQSFRKMFVK